MLTDMKNLYHFFFSAISSCPSDWSAVFVDLGVLGSTKDQTTFCCLVVCLLYGGRDLEVYKNGFVENFPPFSLSRLKAEVDT